MTTFNSPFGSETYSETVLTTGTMRDLSISFPGDIREAFHTQRRAASLHAYDVGRKPVRYGSFCLKLAKTLLALPPRGQEAAG
jgi:hypothetical protein